LPEQEKEYIKKRLKEEAAKCLAQYGVRHTTVDEIVQRVNIPPEVLKEYLEHNSSAVEKVFSVLPVEEGADKDTFNAALRAIYFATLHEEEIGDNYFEDVLYLLFDLFVICAKLKFLNELLLWMFDTTSPYWNTIWLIFILLGGFVFFLGIKLFFDYQSERPALHPD